MVCGSGRWVMAWWPLVVPHWNPGLPACVSGRNAATMCEDIAMMFRAMPTTLEVAVAEGSLVLDRWSWEPSCFSRGMHGE
jgi:hypothetical protein